MPASINIPIASFKGVLRWTTLIGTIRLPRRWTPSTAGCGSSAPLGCRATGLSGFQVPTGRECNGCANRGRDAKDALK